MTAMRSAEDEAGVSGRPEILETFEFRHLKESHGVEQKVVAHILRVIREFEVDEIFRSPQWMTFLEAEAALSTSRISRYAREMRGVLDWAKQTIENSESLVNMVTGVVPVRIDVDGNPQVLLITSKQSKSWVIPKGTPIDSEENTDAALREAREEAGIIGEIIGKMQEYEYRRLSIKFLVRVFPMVVTQELPHWEEEQLRERRWFSPGEAMELVNEVQLRSIIQYAISCLD